MYKKLLLCIVLVLVALILSSTGCVEERETTTLRIGFQPSAHHAAGMIAFEKGWFRDAGINATVAGIYWGGGSPEMEAMRAGEMNVAYVGISPAINAIGHGLDAKVVAAAQKEAQVLVVAATNGTPDWVYTKPSDLEGKTIGTLTAGSIQDVVLDSWMNRMEAEGRLDKSKVTIKYMGIGDMMTGLATKKLDAIYLSEELTEIPVLAGYGAYTNLTSRVTRPNHPCCVLLVSDDLIENHPDIVKKLVEVHINATEYAMSHPEETAEIVSDFLDWEEHGYPKEAILRGLEGEGPIPIGYDTNPHNITETTMELVQVHYERGYIDRPLSESDIFDYSFYDEIMRERGM
ncbi:MAG TPA: ABC transporter substrate-binding protein [Candidatus Syntrophoarchaeum butanivorans]|uniref:ABC transporter substrate-binding protein n=1 Tax=Candidatus Syntropharchaeum butanivorans TaxID=1839936 RepID=A0A7C1B6V4_9EURY|nr:ABC transporter substrate-binding protein [Candidatus Syntrophoarchaeum butanivorans]